MLVQPVEIEQPLANQVRRPRALLFDDHGKAIPVNAEGVDPSVVPMADRMFRCQELDVEQVEQMTFHDALQRSFDRDGACGNLKDGESTAAKTEQTDRASLSCPPAGAEMFGGHIFHSRVHQHLVQAPSLTGHAADFRPVKCVGWSEGLTLVSHRLS
jgi:hypothetical protein